MKHNNMKNSSATDWERVDALTDEQIETSEMPPLDEDFFARATLESVCKVYFDFGSDVMSSAAETSWRAKRQEVSTARFALRSK